MPTLYHTLEEVGYTLCLHPRQEILPGLAVRCSDCGAFNHTDAGWQNGYLDFPRRPLQCP